jgi:hypothetical protein
LEFFTPSDAQAAYRIGAVFKAPQLAAFLAAEAGFELVHTWVAIRVDAAKVVPATAALFEPLHCPPLQQVSAALFEPFVPGGSEEVNRALANMGDNQSVQGPALSLTEEQLHFERQRKSLLQDLELIDVNRGIELFARHHLAIKEQEGII